VLREVRKKDHDRLENLSDEEADELTDRLTRPPDENEEDRD